MLLLFLASLLFAADVDRDGIDDALEQQLLVRFLPTFIVSGGECDVAPAEFAAGVANPKVVVRNGTIYGQVLRRDADRYEIHYYHLWARDCGPKSHALDAEHVSALVRDSRAEYWYAAAHEDTLCDSGNAAQAKTLDSVAHGPMVWISRGKHGSFLGGALCRKGCGGDRCEAGRQLQVSSVINIGERDAPMNGAVWAASPKWPLRAKMQPDFDAVLVGRLESSDAIEELRGVLLPAQVTIAGAGRAVTEVNGAKKRTEGAVSDAEGHTERALGKATHSVKSWLRRRM